MHNVYLYSGCYTLSPNADINWYTEKLGKRALLSEDDFVTYAADKKYSKNEKIACDLLYPAAVDREAEECERIMVDCRVHARSGQLLHGSVAQLLADDVRDGFCSAAGAEVKNRVFHCLFPFLFSFTSICSN